MTHVLAIGTRSAVSSSFPMSSLPPNRCAAHPEPPSYADPDGCTLAVTLALAWKSPYGGVRGSAMPGSGDVASDNRPGSNHPRLA